jgi:hypothetical protein
MLLFDFDGDQAESLKEEIKGRLMPEFEWGDGWLPCFPVVTRRMRRGGGSYYLQPFLLTAAGCSVPTVLPVRMQAGPTKVLSECRALYARHYHRLTDGPKLPRAKKVKA